MYNIHIFLISIFTLVFLTKLFFSIKQTKQNPIKISKVNELLPIFFITILIILVLLQYQPFQISYHGYFRYLGSSFAIFSFYFLISGYYRLGKSWKIGIDAKKKEDLVTEGVFSISRNPVYLFFHIFVFSFFMSTGSLLYLLISILTSISLHLLILDEEKHLEKSHGKKYLDYKKRVKRYFTFF